MDLPPPHRTQTAVALHQKSSSILSAKSAFHTILCIAFLVFFTYSGSINAQYWNTTGNSGAGLLGTTSADSVNLISNDTSRLVLHSNGNIGIGTSKTSGYRLSVNGKVRAREVVVNMDSWSDFVFDSCYKLMDIKSLDTFISMQKHLPDVPATGEVQNNGVGVGEMNKILLQKVEELTLYLIQQQKEIDVLKEEIKKH